MFSFIVAKKEFLPPYPPISSHFANHFRPSYVIGNKFHGRASVVTSVAECKQLLRSVWKSKYPTSIVIIAATIVVNGRHQRYVAADWKIYEGATLVLVALKNASVKNGRVFFKLRARKFNEIESLTVKRFKNERNDSKDELLEIKSIT